ncbi:hypothetical protein BJ878DRAFT_136501 [Calycina marina]|uniref:DUF788-domain-containing protein n=1 Tax=Calycina marina TaxID=1763456 RepID=A0A9P7Z0K3_9HELO|nr:hypothetical protein BJ878DRAFT_136501 [Calycina marina]
MAQKAKKDRAKSNTATLNSLHIGTLTLNILFLILSLSYLRRSLLTYAIFSIPTIICSYILETTGRPKYDSTHTLKSAGEDLSAQGLTEYMFDVVWITWASLVAVVLAGNWGWLLWGVVPVYGAWKGYGILGMAKGMMGGAQGGQMTDQAAAVQAGNRKQRRMAA